MTIKAFGIRIDVEINGTTSYIYPPSVHICTSKRTKIVCNFETSVDKLYLWEKILDSRRHITLYCIKQYSVNPTFHPFYEFPIFSVLCNRLSLNLSTNISCFIPGLSSTDRSCKQQLDTLESSSQSGKPFSWSSVVTVCDNFGQVVFHKDKPHEKGSSQFSQLLGQ